MVNVSVIAVLATATVLVDDFEQAARRAVYGDQVRVAVRTGVQEVVLTGTDRDSLGLYLDGRLRVSARDEHRYHEALVHPAMDGPRARVLILGGGDGLAAREVLRYRDVRSVTLVEIDPAVTRLARTDPALSELNGHAYRDPRLTAVGADAFTWLRADHHRYDVVISDLPDPGITASTKLYSAEFYGLIAEALAPVAASWCTRARRRSGPGPSGRWRPRYGPEASPPARTASRAAPPATLPVTLPVTPPASPRAPTGSVPGAAAGGLGLRPGGGRSGGGAGAGRRSARTALSGGGGATGGGPGGRRTAAAGAGAVHADPPALLGGDVRGGVRGRDGGAGRAGRTGGSGGWKP